ncbi:CLUMA_CG008293, isoform A [Clunio marinus]|uniref:CLUMA_CG008293, isoform A n=1 Tax=Clunio marinus TaxID=568069 RepID=A0A1J1I391_9DIPT|nr:CLUMA_CG008293, isoform A [Clunio marinus]
MPCSAVTLSLATVISIVSVALLAIAFSTDNWLSYEVKRKDIMTYAAKHSDSQQLVEQVNTKYYFYTRTRGLFRNCYPKERPPVSAVELYLSPIETHCSNIDYFPTIENGGETEESTRLHLARSVIALFVLSFFAVVCAFFTGLSGCWRRSAGAITATAILMLTACLLASGAMGLWHTVEFFEKEKVVGPEFFQQWPQILKDKTQISYDWSYIVSWAAVACMLIAAILLSGAAVCLRSEREKEEQLNLQYLMPVYPQKQPAYAYPPYPQQVYPGAFYGSQYGPGPGHYNY